MMGPSCLEYKPITSSDASCSKGSGSSVCNSGELSPYHLELMSLNPDEAIAIHGQGVHQSKIGQAFMNHSNMSQSSVFLISCMQ